MHHGHKYNFVLFIVYRSVNLKQTKITIAYYIKLDKKTSARYTNSIAYWIATYMQLYCVASKNGFKHLMPVLCPGYEVPSYQVFSAIKICALYYEL